MSEIEDFTASLEDVTRVDVIVDSRIRLTEIGIEFVAMLIQDDNRTLKVFLKCRDDDGASVNEYRNNLAASLERAHKVA